MSLRAASCSAVSASRAIWMASPKRTTHRANGLGILNSSQDRSRHSDEAPTATGTTAAPLRRASPTMPGLTTSRGPLGPSGTTTTL